MLHGTIRNDDFSATYCCNIVPTLFRMVATLPILQRCVALKLVVSNRPVNITSITLTQSFFCVHIKSIFTHAANSYAILLGQKKVT